MLEKIISGGQTGVDRAALDVALDRGICCGGWCPRNRRAEDGRIDNRYPLVETPKRRYSQRTQWNVRDADGTLIFATGQLQGGTLLTCRLAEQLGKPCFRISFEQATDWERICRVFFAEHIRVLNIAGPRESTEPGVYAKTVIALHQLLDALANRE